MRARAAALIAACALAGCGGPAPIEARPALWRVADADTTVWLLGSIHALPPGVDWRTPAIAAAIDRAEALVLEIPPPREAEAAALFTRFSRGTGLPPILARVAPARRAALLRAIDAAGITLAEANALDSWAAAVTITGGAERRRGAVRENGVEAMLAKHFTRAAKPIAGLETLGEQLALFDTLPQDAQRVLLEAAIDDALRPESATRAAWVKGDTAALAATLAPGFAAAPVLEDTLVTRRNARWSRWIARRMGRPGRVLVAVGAGHLVGPRSVIAMLRAGGYRVTRVQ